jgi:replication initiation protein RepC
MLKGRNAEDLTETTMPAMRLETKQVNQPAKKAEKDTEKPVPLGLVLKACPDIVDYAKGAIESWRDLMAAAVLARSILGVSPSAYQDACEVLGQERAAIIVACILQRTEHINSAGGYLRNLTEKARIEAFSVWPMLLAQLRANGGHLAVVE